MFSLSLFVSFLIWKTAGSSSLVAVAGCDGRSDKKELQESIEWKYFYSHFLSRLNGLFFTELLFQDMTTALLHAHRCMLKDEPVPVPIPLNTIPDMIVPSHIIVPRCSGETQAEYKHFGHDGVQPPSELGIFSFLNKAATGNNTTL